jgi:hypothetical protein
MSFFPSLLYLKELRCVKETEGEWGNDSPYFVVFVGNLAGNPSSDVVRKRDPAWDGQAYSGKLFTPNLLVHTQVGTNSVVVVAMVEEDDNADIGTAQLTTLKMLMQAKFQYYSSWNLTLAQRASLMSGHLSTYVKDLLGNDDFIQSRHLPIASEVGDLPLLDFYGDGGHYRVRFNMVSTSG